MADIGDMGERVPPLLSKTSAAINIFEFSTLDGATWRGRQVRSFRAVASIPALTHITAASATSSGTRQTLTPGVVAAGATLLLFFADTMAGSTVTPTVSDTRSGAWTVDATVGSTGARAWRLGAR